jgi:hypothetical protein
VNYFVRVLSEVIYASVLVKFMLGGVPVPTS